MRTRSVFLVLVCLRLSGPASAQWVPTTGPQGGWIRCLLNNGTTYFAGTWGVGVWRRPLSEMVSVSEPLAVLPVQFHLEQNYPNPFNPSTEIRYQVSGTGMVTLKVYDVLGREVATLVNEPKPAGTHAQEWNAVNVSSGIYFYRLQAGTFTETKKLLLLKVTRNSFVGAHHDVL